MWTGMTSTAIVEHQTQNGRLAKPAISTGASLMAANDPKRSAQERQTSEGRIQLLLEQASEAVVILDTESNCFVAANNQALHLFNTDYGTLSKLGVTDISALKQANGRLSAELAREAIQQGLNGNILGFPWVYRTELNQLVSCDVILARLSAPNHKLICLWITEWDRPQQPMRGPIQSSDSKFRMMADLSRDLVNQLSKLRLRLYRMKSEPQHLTDLMPGVEHLAQEMELISRDLLRLAHFDSDSLPTSTPLTVRDLNPVIQDAIEQCTPMAKNKALTLRSEFWPERLEAAINQKLLKRALIHLVSNAVDHTPVGGKITITTRQEGELAIASVHASGMDVSPEVLFHIIHSCYQSEEVKGTIQSIGLTLMVIKDIVHKHNGTVQFISIPRSGSTFEIRLPLANGPSIPAISDETNG